jgi:hypothetical protein
VAWDRSLLKRIFAPITSCENSRKPVLSRKKKITNAGDSCRTELVYRLPAAVKEFAARNLAVLTGAALN